MFSRRVCRIVVPVGILVLVIAYVAICLTKPLPELTALKTVAATKTTTTSTPQVAWSGYGEQAIGAVGYGLITSNGQNKQMPTASVAKVMAALAVLQKKPLQVGEQGPTITISDADVAIYNQDNTDDQSIVPVQTGEQISEYQALQAMLIPSATNLATTLTNWAFGSQSAYTSYANTYAKTLGMTQTNFADASGYSPQTVSTPSDLITLGIAAVQNPVIKDIVKQSSVTLPVAGKVDNFNIDVGIDGIDGIKTGNTDEAGGALLYSANQNGLELVGVTLGAPDLGTALHDAPEILDSFKSTIQSNTVIKATATIGTYKTPWGATVNAVATKQLLITDFQATTLPLKVSLQQLSPKNYNPATVGSVSFSYRGQQYTSDVKLTKTIGGPGIFWRLVHP